MYSTFNHNCFIYCIRICHALNYIIICAAMNTITIAMNNSAQDLVLP